MALFANLSPNGLLAFATTYPVRLWQGGETGVVLVVPKGSTSVSATVACEAGSANVHIALFAAPQTSGGPDGVLIGSQVDLISLGTQQQTISVAVPSAVVTSSLVLTQTQPAVYICRLWVDGITGTATGKSRTGGAPDMLPTGVKIYSMAVT